MEYVPAVSTEFDESPGILENGKFPVREVVFITDVLPQNTIPELRSMPTRVTFVANPVPCTVIFMLIDPT
jgi:hypothetical protein